MDDETITQKSSLIPAERRIKILEYIESNRSAQIKELAEIIEVSEATIRRDLEVLSSDALIKRTHGGAVIRSPGTSYEQSYPEKWVTSSEEKREIGQKAAEFVKDGDTLILDSGSTTLEVARHLTERKNLTVITYDLYIANNVNFHPSTTVIVTGGLKRDQFNVLIGSITEDFFRNVKVDKAFLSADAIDIGYGISNATFMEVTIKRLIVKASRQVILVADHSKFGITALAKVCPIEDIDCIVTDHKLDEVTFEQLKRMDISIY